MDFAVLAACGHQKFRLNHRHRRHRMELDSMFGLCRSFGVRPVETSSRLAQPSLVQYPSMLNQECFGRNDPAQDSPSSPIYYIQDKSR